MMKMVQLTTIFATLLLFTTQGLARQQISPYSAGDYGGYGLCGDGELQRPPDYNRGGRFMGYELCDGGQMMIDAANAGVSNMGQSVGCIFSAENNGCKILERVTYNGIIEHYDGGWEECDDGNQIQNDMCDNGHLVGSYDYYANTDPSKYCGNGVIDSAFNEVCDAGAKSSTVCPDGCQRSGLDVVNGYSCAATELCGDGIVDPNTGEQCDLGKNKNGAKGSLCTSVCTLAESNPVFKNESSSFTFFKGANDIHIDTGWGGFRGGSPKNPINSDKLHIYDRGRVIQIDRDPGTQYSGIFHGRSDSDSLDRPVDISFSMRSADGIHNFDNDWFGLVLGAPQNFRGMTDNQTVKYLMLVWRDSKIAGSGDYSKVLNKKGCQKKVYAGDEEHRGLKLYAIEGVPQYNELWGMMDCEEDTEIITEIPTQVYQNYQATSGWQNVMYGYNRLWLKPEKISQKFIDAFGKEKIWNKRVNPAYTWSPFYYTMLIDAGYGRQNDVVQVRVRYDKSELKAWVNHQLVIEIDALKVKEILGYWPETSNWGFYILGMDNFIADFRSPEKRIIASDEIWTGQSSPKYEAINNPKGTRCGHCGDGIVNGNSEKCDGGPKGMVGCKNDCTPEVDWKCFYNSTTGADSVCYLATLITPKPASAAAVFHTTPIIDGSYSESTQGAKITVDIVMADGSLVNNCNNLVATLLPSGLWNIDPSNVTNKNCFKHLQFNVLYTVKAYIAPPKNLYPTAGREEFGSGIFKLDNGGVSITKPVGNPAFVKSLSEISGECSGGEVDVDVYEGTKKVTACNPVSCTASKKWECQLNDTIADNGYYKILVNSTVEKLVTVVSQAPNTPTIFSGGIEVTDNAIIAVENGKLHLTGSTSPWGLDRDPLEYVVITVQNKRTNQELKVRVPVKNDGSYKATIPLPPDSISGDTYTITAQAEDIIGNSSSKVVDNIRVAEGGDVAVAPKITFVPAKRKPPAAIKPAGPVKIKVGPARPVDGRGIKFAKCTNADCSTHTSWCDCEGTLCNEMKGTYHKSSGICEVVFQPELNDNAEIQIIAKASVGQVNVDSTVKYTVDGRRGVSATIVEIDNSKYVDNQTEVKGSKDGLNLTLGMKLANGSLVGRVGDTITAVVNGVMKKCTIIKGDSCQVTFDTTDYLQPLITEPSVTIQLTGKTASGGEVKEFPEKTFEYLPFMRIEYPLDGATLVQGDIIGGSYKCSSTSSNCLGGEYLRLYICNPNAIGASGLVEIGTTKCSEIRIENDPASSHAEWKATQSPGELGEKLLIPILKGTGSSYDTVYPGISVTVVSGGQPIIQSPCLAGRPGCNTNDNKTSKDEIHVIAVGVSGHSATITVLDKDGNKLPIPDSCPQRFDHTTKKLECDIPASNYKDKGPFVVIVEDTDNQKKAETPPINIFKPNKPVIISPCRVGAPGCQAKGNVTPDGKIHIDVVGPAGEGVKVTVTDKDGNVRTIKCAGSADQCKYGKTGRFVKNIDPIDDHGKEMTGPFTIKATTINNTECADSDKCTATVGPINIFNPDKPIIVSPCKNGAPGCVDGNNVTGDAPNKKIHVVVMGPPEAKVDVTVTGKDNKMVNTNNCPDKFNSQGVWMCDVEPKDATGNWVDGPYVVKATTTGTISPDNHEACAGNVDKCTTMTDPMDIPITNPNRQPTSGGNTGTGTGTSTGPGSSVSNDDVVGFVSGGCSSSNAKESGVVSLLLAVLGLAFMRRRRHS